MTPEDRIKCFTEVLEKNYPSKDGPSPRKVVDILKLIKFSPEIMDDFDGEDVDQVFLAADAAAESIYDEKTKVRFKNWHKLETYVSLLRDIRAKDVWKLVTVECDISVFAPPKSSVSSTRFECPSCGNIMTILQVAKDKIIKPNKCTCGRKDKFRKLASELIDVQRLQVREPLELIEHNVQNPRQMGVLLKSDMCHKDMDKLISAGIRVYLTGIVQLEKPDEPESDFIIDAHYISFAEEEKQISFTPEEEAEFKKFAEDTENVLEVFTNSFAPHISGERTAKKGVLLMAVSGDEKKLKYSQDTNQINILLVGDPGTGKSQLGLQIREVYPKTRYINAQTSTAVGLTAAAVKDDFLGGGWSIQAGEIVLAHRGILVIDDFDGMDKEEQDSLHEAMAHKTIHKSAGNTSATLKCETCITAICNPKDKVWDSYRTVADQIDISKSLLNRFDLIYVFKAKKEFDEIEEGLEKIYSTFVDDGKLEESMKVDYTFLKKYLVYAKQLNPSMSKAVLEQCKIFFQKILSRSKKGAIPLTHRQAVSFFKIAKSSAKLRLSNVVTDYDAIMAYNVMIQFMNQVAFDAETGSYDIEMVESEVKHSKKPVLGKFRELLKELAGKKMVAIEDILIKAAERGIDNYDAERFLKSALSGGEAYEPRKGFIKLI